jgi:heme exporter protein D
MDYITIVLLAVAVSTLGLVINLTKSVSDLTRSIDDLGERLTRVGDGIERLATSNTRRITSTATNPFTEAGRRRLLELVDKDDLTLEEAEELHNLARKFYREYIEKTPDAYKVLLYAAAKHGEVLRKHSKQTSQSST